MNFIGYVTLYLLLIIGFFIIVGLVLSKLRIENINKKRLHIINICFCLLAIFMFLAMGIVPPQAGNNTSKEEIRERYINSMENR